MLTTKHASGGVISMRNIVELMLPLLLGVLAIGMRLASFRAAHLHPAFLSPSATNGRTR